MLQNLVHYNLHFLLPLLVAFVFYRTYWLKAYLIMVTTMIIDLDHLLATPIFDPNRCSINFHSLHTYWAIGLYVLLLIPKKTRLVGIGLVIHIIADSADCALM
ncbi:DUF6122 family protein [Bizionia hallyeonensis]|uniref:DUF6122 family protein n=1 Tax=Bizionia hallyeonensis TaxID=1123757 RepID=A0ABW0C6N1_9FLAO